MSSKGGVTCSLQASVHYAVKTIDAREFSGTAVVVGPYFAELQGHSRSSVLGMLSETGVWSYACHRAVVDRLGNFGVPACLVKIHTS